MACKNTNVVLILTFITSVTLPDFTVVPILVLITFYKTPGTFPIYQVLIWWRSWIRIPAIVLRLIFMFFMFSLFIPTLALISSSCGCYFAFVVLTVISLAVNIYVTATSSCKVDKLLLCWLPRSRHRHACRGEYFTSLPNKVFRKSFPFLVFL